MRAILITGALAAGLAIAIPAIHADHPHLFDAAAGLFGRPDATLVAPAISAAHRPAPTRLSGRGVSIDVDARGHFITDFRLNGRPVEAMVDTGASLVAINAATARRVGIALSPADYRHEVVTANGVVRAAAARIDRLEIGRIALDDVDAMVLDDRALSGTLIGMSFLGRLARFGVEDGVLVLQQ